MKSLDDQTLDALAEIICGDAGPLYRKGWELPVFFKRAGLPCPKHDGSTRKWWVLDRLREYNKIPARIEAVVLRLADPREYKGDQAAVQAALQGLNGVLSVEGLEVQLAGVQPRLVAKTPTMAAAPRKPFVPMEPPNFADLTGDASLGTILSGRWGEAQKCVDAGAHVAALVMMGSLLEGALLAVAHAHPETANRAKSCPRDTQAKPKALHEWSLSTLIDVAYECRWVQMDVKKFSHVLREYRNLVHPWQQRLTGIDPDKDTCSICWEVVRAAVNDLAGLRGTRSGNT